MNHEVIAKDANGVNRCYGIGQTEHEALRECKIACLQYFTDRPDIRRLYLYCGDSERPFIDAKSQVPIEVTP